MLVSTVSRGKKREVGFARFFFFFFATGAKIDLRADLGSMIKERSVDRFIAKDYFFFSLLS